MTEGPVQINMYGIRYFINGDLSDPYVKKLMVQARNDLQQMKDRNINNIGHIWLNKPNAYKIVSQFGIDSAYINVPVLVGEKYKKEREVFKIEEEESYRFVPAIVLGTPDIIGTSVSWHWISWQEVGDISVCSGANWEGALSVIKDSPTAEFPGEIYNDGPITDTMEILACRNWGNRDIYVDFDEDEDRSVEELSDPGFSPMPWTKFFKDCLPGDDHTLYGGEALAIKELCETSCVEIHDIGMWGPNDPNIEAAQNACWPDPDWGCDYFYTWQDPVPGWTEHWLIIRWKCFTGSLWGAYKADAYREDAPYTGAWEHTTPIPYTEVGGAQSRFVTDYYWGQYYAYSDADWIPGRSAGEIIFDSQWDYYGYLDDCTYHLTMPALCTREQSDDIVLSEVYPQQCNVYGAYIQDQVDDDGEESQICPIASFHDLYFILIVEEWYEYARTSTADEWSISGGPSYDDYGVYQNGGVYNTQKNFNVSQDELFQVLCINLNGERVEIDRSDDYGDEFSRRADQFVFLDALILDFMGTPVYMYGYNRVRPHYDSPTWYEILYTRYGYFLDDVHYQSEKFYPAGVYVGNNLYGLHDVFGSAARDGKYGFGQCAGFAVKEKTTKKGVAIREPDF